MNKQELGLLSKLNDPEMQKELENLRKVSLEDGESDTLIEDNRTLEDIIREVAEEEGMTYGETKTLFQEGVRKAYNSKGNSGMTAKQKAKAKRKRRTAKASKKRNR